MGAKTKHFYQVIAENVLVVSVYYQSGTSSTVYKGNDVDAALDTYVRYADKNRKTTKNATPVYDVELWQEGKKIMYDIVHDFPTVVEMF